MSVYATELLELGQGDLAADALRRCMELKPDFVEAKYVGARVAMLQGDSASAMAGLREVLKANPRHPQANLTLAKLYAEEGDMASAAACLAAHRGPVTVVSIGGIGVVERY